MFRVRREVDFPIVLAEEAIASGQQMIGIDAEQTRARYEVAEQEVGIRVAGPVAAELIVAARAVGIRIHGLGMQDVHPTLIR